MHLYILLYSRDSITCAHCTHLSLYLIHSQKLQITCPLSSLLPSILSVYYELIIPNCKHRTLSLVAG